MAYTTLHAFRSHMVLKEDSHSMHEASVPWNEKVDQIRYNGDAINLFPEKMSFSCALGHVRAMRGIILTVTYKTDEDISMVSDAVEEERLLVILAHASSDTKKAFALTKAYQWIIVEITIIPTGHHTDEKMPTCDPVDDRDIWKKLTALLIAQDGSLRPHSQLIQSLR